VPLHQKRRELESSSPQSNQWQPTRAAAIGKTAIEFISLCDLSQFSLGFDFSLSRWLSTATGYFLPVPTFRFVFFCLATRRMLNTGFSPRDFSNSAIQDTHWSIKYLCHCIPIQVDLFGLNNFRLPYGEFITLWFINYLSQVDCRWWFGSNPGDFFFKFLGRKFIYLVGAACPTDISA